MPPEGSITRIGGGWLIACLRLHAVTGWNRLGTVAALHALSRFGHFFFGELWETYVKYHMPQS